jgi:hypothetical protein
MSRRRTQFLFHPCHYVHWSVFFFFSPRQSTGVLQQEL